MLDALYRIYKGAKVTTELVYLLGHSLKRKNR